MAGPSTRARDQQESSKSGQQCMQDHYEDCPWREQALYCGDIAVGALLSYYAFGTRELARKCLRQLAHLQHADGTIPALGPAPSTLGFLPEYPAFWVISLWDYYLHWGEADLLEELFPNVLRCMDWYVDHHNEEGIFARRADEQFQPFIDNMSNIAAGDLLAAEQIVYCRSIRCAADIAEAVGHREQADSLRRRSEVLAGDIERLFWSEKRRMLVDSIQPGSKTFTQITNGLALLYGILAEERKTFLVRALLDPTQTPPVRAGYMNFYMVEALMRSGLHREALERVREYWGGMVSRGATTFWETFDPDSPEGTLPERLWSLCHEFCSGPVYSLPAHVAGIKALEPGFSKVEVAPHLVDLIWVDCTVPTPRGSVRVLAMQSDDRRLLRLDLSIPADMACDVLVAMPTRDSRVVYLDSNPLHSGMTEDMLQSVRNDLAAVTLSASGIQLSFTASSAPKHLMLSTLPDRAMPVPARRKGYERIGGVLEFWADQ